MRVGERLLERRPVLAPQDVQSPSRSRLRHRELRGHRAHAPELVGQAGHAPIEQVGRRWLHAARTLLPAAGVEDRVASNAMRVVAIALVVLGLHAHAHAERTAIRCDNQSTADLSVDGMLDDWGKEVVARIGVASDGQFSLRCSWDGKAFAMSLDILDDRVVRFGSGRGEQDHVKVSIAAGGRPVVIDVYPGNAVAKEKISKPAKVSVGQSLQPKGFSIELVVPASVIPGMSGSTPSLALDIAFVDADKAAGGDTFVLELAASVELGDRKDLLDEFLRTVRLRRSDVKLDKLDDLDPDRRGNERIVAGGTVIGVLTDQFAYVSLPVARAADVKKVELLPLGARTRVVAATVRQSGNGGSRDLLMLWTVWTGQLQPLGQIEIRKEQGPNVLEARWKLAKGKKGPELWVEPKSAIGWTAESWNEMPADDADPILLPWDTQKSGIVYTLTGAELARRELPAKKKR